MPRGHRFFYIVDAIGPGKYLTISSGIRLDLLDLIGSGYVLEYVSAFYLEQQDELRYRQYVTEALRLLTENTTHFVIPGYGAVDYGNYLRSPWFEPEARTRSAPQEDTRTADEIALEVITKAGLRLKSGEKNG